MTARHGDNFVKRLLAELSHGVIPIKWPLFSTIRPLTHFISVDDTLKRLEKQMETQKTNKNKLFLIVSFVFVCFFKTL